MKIHTVCGDREFDRETAPVTLTHEHILCSSVWLEKMSDEYLDKKAVEEKACAVLSELKEKYGLGLFVDCTPVNLGRDVSLLKRISEASEVDIVCSSGFYYNDEPVMYAMSAEKTAEYIIEDARRVNAGIIKAAAEAEELSDFNKKLLNAAAIAHKELKLPIVLHTNAVNRNGAEAVEMLINLGVKPQSIIVGHLSDSADTEYIKSIAVLGCYIGFDRIYNNNSEEYMNFVAERISKLCDAGFEKQILLSHDDQVFHGFDAVPDVVEPRFGYVFRNILPRLNRETADVIMRTNPLDMLEMKP